MNKTATRKLRAKFEKKYGFTPDQRGEDVYKTNWRKFKRGEK